MNERYEAWQARLCSPPGLSRQDEKIYSNAILDEYVEMKREMFLPAFAEFVFKQGYGAVSPIKINGKPERWQDCGRRLWGKDHFNREFEKVIERSRAAKTRAATSLASSSS